MRKALVAALLGAAALGAQAQSLTTGVTTGVLNNGSVITGTAQAAFGNQTLTLNVGAGGNNLSSLKTGPGPGVSISSMSAGLSIGSTLGGGVGGTGGTAGNTSGLSLPALALPPGF